MIFAPTDLSTSEKLANTQDAHAIDSVGGTPRRTTSFEIAKMMKLSNGMGSRR
jgi:hypothetical protein